MSKAEARPFLAINKLTSSTTIEGMSIPFGSPGWRSNTRPEGGYQDAQDAIVRGELEVVDECLVRAEGVRFGDFDESRYFLSFHQACLGLIVDGVR